MKTKTNSCSTRIKIKFGNASLVSKKLITNYIKEALETWEGQYHPDHPLRLNVKKVSVGYIITH